MSAPSSSSKGKPTAPDTAPADSGYTRLHISPLDATLLPVVVSSAVLPQARNVSFHTIETFPERRYGFVDLPTEAAEKIKKKFNGATLRGAKMKVDKARAPPAEHVPETEADAPAKKRKKVVIDVDGTEITAAKKRKRDKTVIPGIVLEGDRKVKRGWTITPEQARKSAKTKVRGKKDDKKDDKKDKERREVRSLYTDKEECLIKTVVPPGKPMPEAKAGAKSKKTRKDGKMSREIVAHEFEHVTKFPTFLRDLPKPAKPVSKPVESEPESSSSSSESESSSDEEEEDEAPVAKEEKKVEKVEKKEEKNTATQGKKNQENKAPVEDDTSSSEEDTSSSEDSSSDDDTSSDDDSGDEETKPSVSGTPKRPISSTTTDADSKTDDRPATSSSMKSLTIKIPPPATPATVHPLEALYKKPTGTAPSDQPTNEPFSFFGSAADANSDLESEADASAAMHPPPRTMQPPMTPFTRQDFEERGQRSAAPTPDTAHPSRLRRFFPGDDDDEDDDDNDDEEDQRDPEAQEKLAAQRAAEAAQSAEASDFQKWFWENRGDLNRSWMRRRKTAGKERRMKDNKTTKGFKRG